MAFPAEYASISGSLADPSGSSVLVAAVGWLEGALLGTLATTVAVIAVASVGFMLLAGRVNVRHGLTVLFGCFILFGASSIVEGIQGALPEGEQGEFAYVPDPLAQMTPPPAPPPPADYDPYAGASVARP
jgi:type IV secretory pathway VirB2 component (pilin)